MSQDPMHALISAWETNPKPLTVVGETRIRCAGELREAIKLRPRSSSEDRQHVKDVTEENKRLHAALLKYGSHVHTSPLCEKAKSDDNDCTCGLTSALAKREGRGM